jgi:hypothetical protein
MGGRKRRGSRKMRGGNFYGFQGALAQDPLLDPHGAVSRTMPLIPLAVL